MRQPWKRTPDAGPTGATAGSARVWEGLAVRLAESTWALTPEGIAWLKEDRELSDR